MKRSFWCHAVLFLSALALIGCKDDTPPIVAKIRPVRTVIVTPKPIENDLQAIGDIRPRFETDLGFRVAGKLVSRLVDVGDEVAKGDLIARLDEQEFQTKIRSAKADVAAAQAAVSEAKSAEERSKDLLGKGFEARSAYDSALQKLQTATAKTTSAKAALSLAEDQLTYTELRADFDGIVTAVSAESGRVLAAGQTVVKLAKPHEKDAVFNIAESAFRDRKPNDHPAILVSLLSAPEITTEGVGRQISPIADPATRTYQVKVTLNNPPRQMRFGASVTGRLKQVTAPVIVLPGSALFDTQGKSAVWIYNKASSQVHLKTIVLARFGSDSIIVHEGLVAGDIVVTAGVNRLHEGQKVKLLSTTAAKAVK